MVCSVWTQCVGSQSCYLTLLTSQDTADQADEQHRIKQCILSSLRIPPEHIVHILRNSSIEHIVVNLYDTITF